MKRLTLALSADDEAMEKQFCQNPELFAIALGADCPEVQFFLGQRYLIHCRDLQKALTLWASASLKGHEQSLFYLGAIYFRGIKDADVLPNLEFAYLFWRQASLKGHRDSQNALTKYFPDNLHFNLPS